MSFFIEAILGLLEKWALRYIAKREEKRQQQEVSNADAKRDSISDADVAKRLRKFERD